MQSVVVTGVSTGIGWGIAKVMTGKGFRVFGSVRKQADADRLQAELGESFSPLIFDVTDAAAVARGAAQVRAALGGARLWGLVNNAGIAVAGPLLETSADEFRRQLEVNLIAPMVVVQAFAPMLGTDPALTGPPGRIVNISSVGGRVGAPFLGYYAAAKHGLEGLSESLRRELMRFGIDVIIVAPGSVVTPMWDKAEQIDLAAYRNSPYSEIIKRFRDYAIALGRKGWPPERLGEVVCEALTAARPKARYAPVAGKFQNWILPRMLPVRVVDRIIARTFAIRPSA
ncbi:MAG: SDR family NAD(P)-dependent oxidoreductase [Candidatus Binataceae bacterium]